MNEVYLRKYRDKLVGMIDEGSVEVFENENKDCTRVIIQELIRYAKKFVWVQCSKFFPVVDVETQKVIECAIMQGVDVRIYVRDAIQESAVAAELNKLKHETVIGNTSICDIDFIVTDGNRYLCQEDKGSEKLKGSVNGKEEADCFIECFKLGESTLDIHSDLYRVGFWQFLKSDKVEVTGGNKRGAKVFAQEQIKHAKEFCWIQCTDRDTWVLGDKKTQEAIADARVRGVDVRIQETEGGMNFIVTDGDRCLIGADNETEYSIGCFNGKDLAKHLKRCFKRMKEPQKGESEKYLWITIDLKEPLHPKYHAWMSVCGGNVKIFARWATEAYNEEIKEILEDLKEQRGNETFKCIFAHIFSEGKENIFQYLSEPINELPEKVREGDRLYRIPILAEEINPLFLNVASSVNGEQIVSFVFGSLNKKAERTIREGIQRYIDL